MTKTKCPVENYVEARKNVMEYFQCQDDYFIRPLMEYSWVVQESEDYSILSYWKDNIPRTNAVMVKKNGIPLIFRTEDYTMIVGIDCVKIAFIFCNENEVGN